MTATYWLLAFLIVFILAVMIISYMINAEWRRADEPVYRTADGDTIARQIASLRRNRGSRP